MKTEIDWSKAPEGFPLWLEGTNEEHRKHSGWYRDAGQVFEGAYGGQWRACREGQFFTVHRKPEDYCEHSHGNAQGCPECGEVFSPAWTGEGLPTVGTACEVKGCIGHYQEWKPVTVFAVRGNTVLFDHENGWDQTASHEFRPIRTPEQIAAEERSKACDKMYGVILDKIPQDRRNNGSDICEALYDAGYRLEAKND